MELAKVESSPAKRVITWLRNLYNNFTRTRGRKIALLTFLLVGGFVAFYTTFRKRLLGPPPNKPQIDGSSKGVSSPLLPKRGLRWKGLKISCSTIGVILSHKKDTNSFEFMSDAMDTLIQLINDNDLYLITQVQDDAQEQEVTKILESVGAFQAGLNPHKLLFCSTVEGRAHMARQLEVQFHIDTEYSVLNMLKGHVPQLLLVSGDSNRTDGTDDIKVTSALSRTVPKRKNPFLLN